MHILTYTCIPYMHSYEYMHSYIHMFFFCRGHAFICIYSLYICTYIYLQTCLFIYIEHLLSFFFLCQILFSLYFLSIIYLFTCLLAFFFSMFCVLHSLLLIFCWEGCNISSFYVKPLCFLHTTFHYFRKLVCLLNLLNRKYLTLVILGYQRHTDFNATQKGKFTLCLARKLLTHLSEFCSLV